MDMPSSLDTDPVAEQRKALESFLLDNPDLERLESLLDQFNIFEAIGVIRQEMRHSDFLAFLLAPDQNHGLGDAFARRLLQRAVLSADDPSLPISAIELDVWNLGQLRVLREWHNIDLLLVDDLNRLAVVIENKIGTGEHSNQLARYWKDVTEHYPQHSTLGIYLTPDGSPPTHLSYIPVSYSLVSEVIQRLVESRASTLGEAVRTLMEHYAQMLRRHVVTDSDIARLCRQIYHKHRRALDLIYEHRPDREADIAEMIERLLRAFPELILDRSSKSRLRFLPRDWDSQTLKVAQDWTRTGRVLLMELWNDPGRLQLRLQLGPSIDEETRRRVYDTARVNQPPFVVTSPLTRRWTTLFNRSLPMAKVDEEFDLDELEGQIRQHLEGFVRSEVPAMTDVLRSCGLLG